MPRKERKEDDSLFDKTQQRQQQPKAEPEIQPPPKEGAKAEQARPQASAKRKPGRELAPHKPIAPVASSGDQGGVLDLIRAVVTNPGVDVTKLEALLGMQERLEARRAKQEFDAALAEMQPHLPAIDRKGRIEVRKKDAHGERTGPVQQSTAFARWEDIDEAIKPILANYGFGLSFRTGQEAVGSSTLIRVTAILHHRAGHREETSLLLPHDATGSKNPVQAIGSSTSYGKRYTACALLNISTRGDDDDGKVGGGGPIVPGGALTAEQLEQLTELKDATECPVDKLVAHLNKVRPDGHPEIAGLAQLPQSRFQECVQTIRVYEAGRKELKRQTAEAEKK